MAALCARSFLTRTSTRSSRTRLAGRRIIAVPNSRQPFSSVEASQIAVRFTVTHEGLMVDDDRHRVLPNFWLRDNCRCVKCVNQDTMQRNFNTFDVPRDVRPLDVESTPDGVEITWSYQNHKSFYRWEFLDFYAKNNHRETTDAEFPLSYWGSEIAAHPPTVSFRNVMDPRDQSGIAQLTRYIRTHGFVLVNETPHDDPLITKLLLERIAFIRVTHYGGFYDFTPGLAMADTAYTNLALPAHTDNTYFTEPAGLQAFHLLSHKPPPDAESDGAPAGGESLLVDGFHAARVLQAEDPVAYKILAAVRLPWHASGNKGITMSPDKRYPVLETDEESGDLRRVRWNNDDRGVVPFDKTYSPMEWYEAARKWEAILRRKDLECWTQLVPGKPLIFDNWRVLHGRSAFRGIRRICGAYINRDDYVSRLRNTNLSPKVILDKVLG